MKLKKGLLYALISFFAHDSFSQQQVSVFTELVYKRFYFIERLERSVEFLKTYSINEKIITQVNQDMHCFKNQTIKESINKIIQLKNLQPIAMTWEDFISFKLLDDESYLDDFTKLILIISEKILLHIIPRLPQKLSFDIRLLFEKGIQASYLERLDYIDIAFEALNNNLDIKTIVKKPIVIVDIVKKSYTESVTSRFYYLHRLQKPVKRILYNNQNPEVYFKKINNIATMLDQKISFSHEYIKETVKNMEKEKNLHSLKKLWHEFEHYKFIEDSLFINEFTKLIFILQKNKIMNSSINAHQQKITTYSIQNLIDLYNKLDSLPLEELLNVIDILSNEFPAINEKFEINSDMTWRTWFRKYWWAPPLILGMFTIKSLITIKNIKTVADWVKKALAGSVEIQTEPVVDQD